MYILKIITRNEDCKSLLIKSCEYNEIYKQNNYYCFELNFKTKQEAESLKNSALSIISQYNNTRCFIFKTRKKIKVIKFKSLDDFTTFNEENKGSKYVEIKITINEETYFKI